MAPVLPHEILLDIFEYFTFRNSGFIEFENGCIGDNAAGKIRTLLNLCLSSQQFKRIAEPLLYRTYVKPNTVQHTRATFDEMMYENTGVIGKTTSCPKRSLRLFLCKLIERPDLAESVRSIHLGLWDESLSATQLTVVRRLETRPVARLEETTRRSSRSLLSLSPDVSALYSEHIKVRQSTLRPAHAKWKQALLAGREDAEIAFLLMLTPNVRDIWFTMPPFSQPEGREFFFSKVFEQALESTSEVHPFKHLSMVFAHYWDQTCSGTRPDLGFPLAPFSALARLPTLRTLDTVGTIDHQTLTMTSPRWPCQPGSLAIEKLFLQRCALSVTVMKSLVVSCANLRTLFLECGQDLPGYSELNRPISWPWPKIIEAISSQRKTLETLHLTRNMNRQPDERTGDQGDDRRPIPSLTSFTALKQLIADQSAILGPQQTVWYADRTPGDHDLVSKLPSSLEVLGINSVTLHAIWRLEDLLDAVRAQRFPNLRDIYLDMSEFDYRDEEWREDAPKSIERPRGRLFRLKRGFKSAGVSWNE